MCPSRAMSTPAVLPHTRLSGSAPQFLITFGFGLGRVCEAGSTTSACVNTNPADRVSAVTATAALTKERTASDIRTSLSCSRLTRLECSDKRTVNRMCGSILSPRDVWRSEEHTSELQSQSNLVCRLLL